MKFFKAELTPFFRQEEHEGHEKEDFFGQD